MSPRHQARCGSHQRPQRACWRPPDDGCRYDSYTETGRAVGEERFATATPVPVEIVPTALVTAHWRR